MEATSTSGGVCLLTLATASTSIMAAENKKTSGPPLACAKDREDLIQCVLRTDW